METMQCSQCKNYLNDLSCLAYIDGIPSKILKGFHDHTKPYKGDSGITFEPIDD
jgi:hypothetical protein